jgi:hypothetical protein
MMGMRPGESLSRLDVRCIAEVEPNRACWAPVPPGSIVPLCADHRADSNVVMSVRLSRYTRAVRAWQAEDWRGTSELPWE